MLLWSHEAYNQDDNKNIFSLIAGCQPEMDERGGRVCITASENYTYTVSWSDGPTGQQQKNKSWNELHQLLVMLI